MAGESGSRGAAAGSRVAEDRVPGFAGRDRGLGGSRVPGFAGLGSRVAEDRGCRGSLVHGFAGGGVRG